MSDYQFVSGQFVELVAAKKFHVGKLQTDLHQGAVVLFDGETLRLSGKEHTIPEMRAAFKSGWLTLKGDSPVTSPGTNPQPLIKGNLPLVSHEEQEVGKAVKAKEGQGAPKPFDRTLVQEEEGDHREVAPFKGSKTGTSLSVGGAETGRTVGKIGSPRSEKIDVSVIDLVPESPVDSSSRRFTPSGVNDDSKTVGKIASAAKTRPLVKDSASAEREARRIDTTPKTNLLIPTKGPTDIYAAAGDKVEDILDAVDPGTRAKLLAKQRKEAVARSEAKARSEAPEVTEVSVEEQDQKPVLKITPPRTLEDVVVQGDEVTLAPGVTWNKKLHWRTRAKIAVELYQDKPDILDLIRQYEEPSVVRLIEENLARLTATGGV